MAKEICISSTPHETRLAILEDDQLAEIYYERENEYTLAGSIYNGRVTRVLPGMQSAFVDVGLERDAFLYVTDFIDLEDQEDADELEKAAASGGGQPPREIQHPSGVRQDNRAPRTGQRAEQKQEPKADQRNDRGQRDRRPTEEAAPQTVETSSIAPESPTGDDQEGATGGRRWRGRRHRRGGRGPGAGPESGAEPEELTTAASEALSADETAAEIQASAGNRAAREAASREGQPSREREAGNAPRSGPATATPFVLPGESLSKYGATPDAAKAAPETSAPARPAFTSKPSTLIDAPLEWDGSGLLPGESLSKHRGRGDEPAAAEIREAAAEIKVDEEAYATPQQDEASAAPQHAVDFLEISEEEAPPSLREIAKAWPSEAAFVIP